MNLVISAASAGANTNGKGSSSVTAAIIQNGRLKANVRTKNVAIPRMTLRELSNFPSVLSFSYKRVVPTGFLPDRLDEVLSCEFGLERRSPSALTPSEVLSAYLLIASNIVGLLLVQYPNNTARHHRWRHPVGGNRCRLWRDKA